MLTTVALTPVVDKLYIANGFELSTVTRVKQVKNTTGVRD